MTVSFHKLLTVGTVLVMLAGCSSKGEMPVAGQRSASQSEEQAKAKKLGASEVCLPEAGSPFYYRKVILVAGTIAVPDLARDLPGLAQLTSNRLQTHLDALERFNVLATHDTSFESMVLDTDVRVRDLGRQYASQFVVKLELEDLTIRSSEGGLSKFMYSSGGWLSRLLGGNAQRNVLIKLYIYDTEYGALFHSQEYEGTVSGNVVGYPGNGRTVTTSWFNNDLGKRIDEMLKAMSLQINEKLACVPFSTKVTAVKGNDIHINAGYLNGIRPGDTLRVYRRSDISVPDGARKQGENEGWIRVNAVFPNRSIAGATQDEVGGKRADIGDIVRAW